jgi:diguanylate cyclase (GGDEF)-like protein
LEQKVTQLSEDNEIIHKELNKSIFEILALIEFTNILGGTVDFQRMLGMMVDTIKRIIDYDGCCLFLIDESRHNVSVAISRGLPETFNQQNIPLDQFFAENVLSSGQAVLVEDIYREIDRFPGNYTAETFGGLHSMIILPLLVQNSSLGVLMIAKNVVSGFSYEDLRLLFVISNEAALAIQNKHLYEKVYNASISDGLTGLYNHKYFREQLQTQIQTAKAENRTISLILMDIDYFKTINDTYGHLIGDMVLQQIAVILKSALPDEFLIARYGGEEFAALLPETNLDLAMEYCEIIRSKLEEHSFNSEEGTLFKVTISLGVANYPKHISNEERIVEKLIDLADESLYQAKREGRNRVCTLPEVVLK